MLISRDLNFQWISFLVSVHIEYNYNNTTKLRMFATVCPLNLRGVLCANGFCLIIYFPLFPAGQRRGPGCWCELSDPHWGSPAVFFPGQAHRRAVTPEILGLWVLLWHRSNLHLPCGSLRQQGHDASWAGHCHSQSQGKGVTPQQQHPLPVMPEYSIAMQASLGNTRTLSSPASHLHESYSASSLLS